MSRALLAALALPLLAGGRALGAQPARDDSADSAVVATVQRLFDAMARRDTATLRALLVPGARFTSLPTDRVVPAPRVQGDSAFLRTFAAGTERLLERMWQPVVHVEGPLATLWAPYDFHVDGKRSHCGVDAVTLLRGDAGWRVTGITYTVQRAGCAPSPLGPP